MTEKHGPAHSGRNGQLPEIRLPKLNRQESVFAAEMGKAIDPHGVLFRCQDKIVEIKDEPFSGELDKNKLATGGLKFSVLTPTRARTWMEDYVTTGIDVVIKDHKGQPTGGCKFVRKTMEQATANGLLVSPQFERHIPVISRILDVTIPIKKRDGTVITPVRGFNRSLGIYCNPSSPEIVKMNLEEARKVIEKTIEGFAWKNKQSKVHAIARMLTPFGRGLMGFNSRTPLWYFSGNRPRAGKDYLAGVTQIIYLGQAFEDASLGEDSEETRKRITAAIVSGRRMMHFANCQGYIESPPFIQAITATVWRTRALGSTAAESDLELANEVDYSMSANSGLTYREDIDGRIRKIELAFFEEDENARQFPNVFLHDWVTENRSLILSAIAAFFNHWREQGMKHGSSPFNSFPQWAAVIGGVMKECKLGDPCLPHEDKDSIGGDKRTIAMQALYSLVFGLHPNKSLTKQDIFKLIAANQADDDRLEWFGHFEGDGKREANTKTGKAIRAYQNRILGGVIMEIDTSNSNTTRHQITFKEA